MKNRMQSNTWVITVPVALAISAINPAWSHDSDLTIVSWGGAYTRSQILAYVDPYEQESGASIDVQDYNGGLKQIRSQVASHNTTWDLVDANLADAIRGCEEGLLEKIDHSILSPAPDGTPAVDDFLPGLLPECAVGEVIWSTVIAYDGKQFKGDAPDTVADFFDLTRYPGRRALRRSPQVSLEWALMADGVPTDKVYETLSTDAGVERAFAKLDTIKDAVVWWEAGAEPPQLLESGEVAMTSAFNGRMFDPIEQGRDFVLVWDGQVWDADLWVIPKRTRRDNLEDILSFITFATSTKRLADQAKYIPYGPARRSSMAMVNDAMKALLPTAPENAANALELDAKFWAENQTKLERLFEHWLARKEPFASWHVR